MIDRLTVFGLLATVAIVLGVMVGGTGLAVGVFWQAPSALLVLGGSVLATVVSLPPRRAGSIIGVLRSAFRENTPSPQLVIGQIVSMAEIARRHGMLALDEPSKGLSDEFLRRAIQMAVDGMDAATIEHVMRNEMEATDLRHTYGKGVLETMGRFSPVFGMIGTLIGLVVMLGHMTDPSRIGPGMAVALLTTLYGLLIANVFCLPLARKLAGRSSDELMVKQMMLKGVLAIQAGDHPRIVEQKLRAYIPGSERERRKTGESVASSRQDSKQGSAPPSVEEGVTSQLSAEPATKAEVVGQREAA